MNENLPALVTAQDLIATLPFDFAAISADVEQAGALRVLSQDDMRTATEIGKRLKNAERSLEEARKVQVAPLNDHVKRINGLFKVVAEPVANAGLAVRRQMEAWQAEQARIAREEQERLRKEAETRALEAAEKAEAESGKEAADKILESAAKSAPPTVAVGPTLHRSDSGAVAHTRKTWEFELEDISQVPIEFLALDEKAVRKAISKGAREIGGLRIFEKESVVIR